MSRRLMSQSDRVLARLLTLHPKIIDLSLDRMERLLRDLGHPERKLPPVIHVAGTNGKGSVVAYLRAILEAAGLRVHVYTSPHLVRFAERIRLAGKLISEDALEDVLERCEQINGDIPITYFEITTAAAFLAFSEIPADVVLLEVGLGGRLDATNMVDQPLATVLTPISMDHEQFLGNNVAAIAKEKAGIAKKGVPLITGDYNKALLGDIRQVAKDADIITDWSHEGQDYRDRFGKLHLPLPRLGGDHQLLNAAIATATLRHQNKFDITQENIATGIRAAHWPARLQDITGSYPLPDGSRLWLDGGHNPAAGTALANYFKGEKIHLICAMMANKDVKGYLAPLAPMIEKFYGMEINGEDSHSAEEMAGFAKELGIDATAVKNVTTALEQIKEPRQVMICGSLYLAGHILREAGKFPE